MTFEQATDNIIFDNENMIGFSWDIERYIKFEMEYQKGNDPEDYECNEELFTDLLNDLEDHDGLVKCSYHPMGAYFVEDLVVKGEE